MSSYLGWEEFEDAPPALRSTPEEGVDDGPRSFPEGIPDEARSRLEALMAERARLEKQLKRLTGESPPDEEERRKHAMFPMPIHTRESRMAERNAQREEQRARARARRVMESHRLEARDEVARAESKREAERKALQAISSQKKDEGRHRERHNDWLRRLRLEETLRGRWTEQREMALRQQSLAQQQRRVLFDERNEERRRQAVLRLIERRNAEVELYARLDRRGANKKDWRTT